MIPNMPSVSYTPFLREEGGGDRECSAEERKAEENNLVCMCVYEREKEWEIYKQLYMLRGKG